MKKLTKVLIGLLVVALAFTACTPAEVEKVEEIVEEAVEEVEAVVEEEVAEVEPIYFAWYGPLTGDAKQYGDTEKIAVELALAEINEEWGGVLGGRKIIVDFFDDGNDAKETVIIANKIVGAGKYTAAIGGFSSTPTMAAAPIFEEAKLVNYSY